MSYNVSIKAKLEGVDEYVQVSADSCNVTWNVRELIAKCSGWEIQNEASNGPVLAWYEKISAGLKELKKNPEKYKQFEAPNGWGTVNGVVFFFTKCKQMVEEFVEFHENLLPVAVIWVD